MSKELIRKAFDLYKLVSLNNGELSEEQYKIDLSVLTGKDLVKILEFIEKYDEQPYFTIEDLFPQFWLAVSGKRTFPINAIIQMFIAYHKKTGKDETAYLGILFPYLVKRMLNELPFNDIVYLEIERAHHYISNDLLEEAQKRVIAYLIEASKTESMDDWMATWKLLEEKSEFLSTELLIKLTKKLDIEFYLEVMDHMTKDYSLNLQQIKHRNAEAIENIIHQSKFDIYDLAYIFRLGAKEGFRIKLFFDIINRSKFDPEMVKYLRGFIYFGLGFFMLDDDLKPMSSQYQKVAWPSNVTPMHLDDVDIKYQKVWQRIFGEFNVIPQ